MKEIKYLICLIFILLISGCAINPEITSSNKAFGYHKRITSLSIIYLANKLGADESQIKQCDFKKLRTAFVDAGIKTDLFFYSEMDLNVRQHFNSYAKKNPYLLIVNPVQMTKGDLVSITYDLSLYDVKNNQKIWAADLWVPFGFIETVYERYDEMGGLIVNKLRENNLIS